MKRHIVTAVATAAVVSSAFLLNPVTKVKEVVVSQPTIVKNDGLQYCASRGDCYKYQK